MTRWIEWVCVLWLVSACGCGGDESQPDTTPPGILSNEPAANAAGIAADAKIRVLFDEPIDRNTLSAEVFFLVLNSQKRFGNVSYDLDRKEATLVMSRLMDAGATYQAILEPSVHDLAGNKMTESYHWLFTVAE